MGAWPDAVALLAPLVAWFSVQGRRLPWRAEDLDAPHPDPYAVLVSELMLQQTLVATVLPYYRAWMARWPSPGDLAAATEDEVHKAWEGLGYYRLARHLHGAARAVAARGWPRDREGLAALPGLGPYTAAAVAAIAFQQPEPALDGNAFRVLARLLALREDPRNRSAELGAWLRPALAAHGPSRLTQALMELGALRCARRPACPACPLQDVCGARALGLQGELPSPRPRAEARQVELWVVAPQSGGRWLLQPPARAGLLAGLWRWPTLPWWPPAALEAAEAAIPFAMDVRASTWPAWRQAYSHRLEHVHPVRLHLPTAAAAPPGLRWIEAEDLARLPLGRRDQRLRERLLEEGEPLPASAARRLERELFA